MKIRSPFPLAMTTTSLVLLAFTFGLAGCDKPKSASSSDANSPSTTSPAAPAAATPASPTEPIVMTPQALVEKIREDQTSHAYKVKRTTPFQVTGVIWNFGFGSLKLKNESKPELLSVDCMFVESDQPKIAKMNPGDTLTVRGKLNAYNETDKDVELMECTIVPAAGSASPAAPAAAATNSLDGVREAVQGITEHAVTGNEFKKLAECFAKADKDRVLANAPADTTELDAAIAEFRAAYKAKYNREFKIKDPATEYAKNFLQIEAGETDANDAKVSIMDDGAPGLIVHFVREGSEWKLKTEDRVNGKVLYDDLIRKLNKLTKGAATWPAGDVAADQAVTLAVFIAAMGD